MQQERRSLIKDNTRYHHDGRVVMGNTNWSPLTSSMQELQSKHSKVNYFAITNLFSFFSPTPPHSPLS